MNEDETKALVAMAGKKKGQKCEVFIVNNGKICFNGILKDIARQNQNAVWVQALYVNMQLGYVEHRSSIMTAEDIYFLTLRLITTILLTSVLWYYF